MKKIFQSKPTYLWLIAVTLAFIFVPIVTNKSSVPFTYVLIAVVSVYFVGVFSIKYFCFYEDSIEKIYPFRPPWLARKECILYGNLFLVEVRNRKESYQRPYVILHRNKKKIKSTFFFHRAFIYQSIEGLKPLIRHLVKKKVKVRLNMTKEYQQQFDDLSDMLNVDSH